MLHKVQCNFISLLFMNFTKQTWRYILYVTIVFISLTAITANVYNSVKIKFAYANVIKFVMQDTIIVDLHA